MGKNKQQKVETFESTTEACATCWYGEENEHGSIKCPLEVEPMGRADRCGEWTATEPIEKTLINGVDVTDNSSPTGIDQEKMEAVIRPVIEQALTPSNAPAGVDTNIDTSLSGNDLTSEMPSPSSTVDFHLYKIEGFAHELSVALHEVYNYFVTGGTGPVAVNIKLTGFEETVKASMSVTLPHTVKLESTLTEVVKENGQFRIVLPSQPALFEE